MSATNADPSAPNTSSFVAALVVAGITVGAFTAIWAVLHGRKNLRQVYQPRTIYAPESKRPKELPDGLVTFWKTVLTTHDQDLIVSNGLDAYLFVRFLKVFGVKLLIPYFLLTFIICVPVSAAGETANQPGLDAISFGNVSPFHSERRIAHFLVAIILMAWTCYNLWKEYSHFVAVRQAWLTSAQHLTLARSRTVALTNLPEAYQNESSLKELAQMAIGTTLPRSSNVTAAAANEAPDVNVWVSHKVKKLEKVFDDRNNECSRLEGGVAKLLKLAAKNQRKNKAPGGEDPYLPHRYVDNKKLPTWKQGPLGLFGKKMNLDTSPEYIAEYNDKLREMRGQEYPLGNTVFMRFHSQNEAHAFARSASSADKSLKLVKSSVELVPEDVQWSNMSQSAYQRKIGTLISWGLTIGLIIIWAIPVAFVGIVSRVDTLCEQAPWLAWICRLPAPVLGIIRGVLPPVLLAVLFMLLPMVLRFWVKMQGEIRKSDIELKLFTRFWLFQVIHGFLIVTLATGLVNALGDLGNTASSVPTLLATKLPGASIFFLTFILTATFAGATKIYARVVPFAMYLLKGILGGNTPRKWYNSTYKMNSFQWATTWPPICLLTTITIVYSVIQPLITALALLAFCILYAAYKYQLHWCCDQPDYLETGGMFYIRAIRTIFVALYLEGICLAGLFFLSTDGTGARSKAGLACGALMIVAIICVIALQVYIDWFAFKPGFLEYVHSSHPTVATDAKLHPVPTGTVEEAENAGPEYGNTTGFHERAFDHPALWKKQPVVWVADDSLGLGRDQVDRINAKKVEASTEYASMDGQGKLDVVRGPPDEAWYGGHTA